mmetsp:Transcript_2925/g.11844  ORF Transcript_2925/g.11844 Transcript_2925/m.11844 type:complete len:211 (-) Transcript_2925:30-662(-)
MDDHVGILEQDLDLDSLSGLKRYQERLLSRESSVSRQARVWRRYLLIDAAITALLALSFFVWAVVNGPVGSSVETRLSFDLGIIFFAMLLAVGILGAYVAYAPNVNRTRLYLLGNVVAHLGIAAAAVIAVAKGALRDRELDVVYGSIACGVWVVNLIVSAAIAYRLHRLMRKSELLRDDSRGSSISFSYEALEHSDGSGGVVIQPEATLL